MTKAKKKIKLATAGRVLEQVAALPYRWSEAGALEILVMSSRQTQRVIIPKGWPMKNRKDWKSAQIEAREEVGVVGEVGRKRIGQYRYWKRLEAHFVLCKVSVFPLAVKRHLDDWPERHERAHKWLTPEDAAVLVDETDLGKLILEFAKAQQEHRRGMSSDSDRHTEAGQSVRRGSAFH